MKPSCLLINSKMEIRKVFLATMGFAMSVCAANAQTPITENSNYVTKMHSVDLETKVVSNGSGGKTQLSPSYFINCYDKMKSAYDMVFQVNQEGYISGSGLSIVQSGVNNPYTAHLSMYWNNSVINIAGSGYRGSKYPVVFSFSNATFMFTQMQDNLVISRLLITEGRSYVYSAGI